MEDIRDDEADRYNYSLLDYLMSSIRQSCNLCASEQVLYNFNVRHLPVDNEIEGELIITESQVIFIPNSKENQVRYLLHIENLICLINMLNFLVNFI